MCVIFLLRPGYTLPFILLQNAAYNNEDGYGIVIKNGKKLTVIKKLDPDGTKPQEVYDILKKNEQYERVVHLRHRTRGTISIENVQPVLVHKQGDEESWFFHNGSLSEYGNSPAVSYSQAREEGKSDSVDFAERVIEKLMAFNPDVLDPTFALIANKFWGFSNQTNKGLIVSSARPDFFFGYKVGWEVIKTSEIVQGKEVKDEFLSSNNMYFNRTVRGRVYEAAIQEERKKRALEDAAKAGRSAEDEEVETTGEIDRVRSGTFQKQYGLGQDVSKIVGDADLYSYEGMIAIGNLSYEEVELLLSSELPDAVSIFLHVTESAAKALKEFEQLNEKLMKASRKIAELTQQEKKNGTIG